MMKVKLVIYSNLKHYVENYRDHDGVMIEISEKTSIRQLLEETIRHEHAMDAISMVIVNEKVVPFNQLDRTMQDGDIIKVYPPMGGG